MVGGARRLERGLLHKIVAVCYTFVMYSNIKLIYSNLEMFYKKFVLHIFIIYIYMQEFGAV